MAKSGTQLGPIDLSSDVPLVETSGGQELILHQVSLTFGHPFGQADLWSDVPLCRGIYWPKTGTQLCPVDLS